MRLCFAALAVFALSSTVLAACEKPEPKSSLNYTADAKRSYDTAMEEFKSKNYLEAQGLMREVKRKFSYSKYARLAELRIADCDFLQEKYGDAIRGYKQFIHEHKSDLDEVAYARAQIAESEFKQLPDTFILSSAEERDQASVLDAYKELRGFLHDYPDAKESARVRKLLADVTARLVRHELYVARFYLNRDNYHAAVSRIQFALRNYSAGVQGPSGEVTGGSGLEPEALLLLGETYLKMKKYSEARKAFLTLLDQYPKSTLIEQAQKFLEHMQTRGG